MDINVNYPFFMYPGYPINGYKNLDFYLTEVLRLYQFVEEYKCDKKTLFHFNIGATMEELRGEYANGWRQLFPIHLEQVKCPVHLVIVSPNESFNNNNTEYTDPEFIQETYDKYEWEMIDKRHYVSADGRVTVDIFCTMMPTDDMVRNKRFVNRAIRYNFEDNMMDFKLSKCTQMKDDLVFVEKFYYLLDCLFNSIEENGGFITCYNHAVFRNDSENSVFNNYGMFQEIQKLFMPLNQNRLLAEWSFNIPIVHYELKAYLKNIKVNSTYKNGFSINETEQNLQIVTM